MGLFRKGKPNVRALARRGDVHGLLEAAAFHDLLPGQQGGAIDVGAAVREEAILALGELGSDAGNGHVARALGDPSDRVRVAAVRVLYAREEAAPLAHALAWLPADRGHARRLALQALGELGSPGAAKLVAGALVRAPGAAPVSDADGTILVRLLDGEQSTEETSEVVDELLAALADDRDAVADRAEELLALLAPASTEGVIAELRAGACPDRAAAVLGRIGDTWALEPLVEALEHRDKKVRAEAAAALGEMRDPAAVEPLMRATRDPEHSVRAQAGWALDRLGAVAVMVGVSHLVRPMIHEAVTAAVEGHSPPALASGNPDNGHPPDDADLADREEPPAA